MTDRSIYLTSLGNENLPALVLVHGWGHDARVWQPLAEALQGRYRIHLLDLPGYGKAQFAAQDPADIARAWTLESLLENFLRLPIESAIWCGWSLGGMLATYYAACYPTRVRGLLSIASNACFVQRRDWLSAMPPLDYERFEQALQSDPAATLMRFLGLVVQGSPTARQELRTLKGYARESLADAATLQSSLKLLQELDTRSALASLAMPQCHLFGEQDALVPASAASLVGLLNDRADVRVIEGAGHAAFLSHLQSVLQALGDLARRL